MRNQWLLSLVVLSTGCVDLRDVLDWLGGGSGGGGTVVDPEPEPEPEPVEPVWVDPGSLEPVILDCATSSGYEVDTLVGEAGAPSVWLASVYETHSNHRGGHHPMGYATVHFDLPGDNVLALASYEPVTWQITLGDQAQLSRIVVFGYHQQVVEIDADVPVEFFGAPYCGYSLPYNGGGCDTDALIDAVEGAAGAPLSRFDGCYQATDFQFVVGEGEPEPEPEPVVACGPGSVAELSIPISELDMRMGASDRTGPGVCSGLVQFSHDLSTDLAGRWNYATNEHELYEFNGWAVGGCGSAHCNDLTYGDGRVREDYCTVIALCEDGEARAVGYTW